MAGSATTRSALWVTVFSTGFEITGGAFCAGESSSSEERTERILTRLTRGVASALVLGNAIASLWQAQIQPVENSHPLAISTNFPGSQNIKQWHIKHRDVSSRHDFELAAGVIYAKQGVCAAFGGVQFQCVCRQSSSKHKSLTSLDVKWALRGATFETSV
jgi:hypothetical protein